MKHLIPVIKYLIIVFVFCGYPFAISAQSDQVEPADSLHHELQEIVVRAQQPATRLSGTTLVSTIAGSSLSTLGTCLDVLAQLPMITVTDNAVSVVGRGAPEVYIDGRPMRESEELVQLRSDDIRRVELLMAPGAMYASDTRAVLKIITRRKFVRGLSVTDRAEATARRRWSANNMLELNYRTGAVDIFATGTVAYANSLIKGNTINTLMYDGAPTVVGSTQHNTYPTANGTVKVGANYAATNHSLGAYYRFNPERGDFENIGSEWLDDNPPLHRDITRNIRAHSHLVSVYYDGSLGGSWHLHFDGDYRVSSARNRVSTTYPSSPVEDVNSRDRRSSTLWAANLYATHPLWGGEMTVGTRDSYTRSRLDYHMLNTAVGEYIPSRRTDARQTSLAAFASWSRTLGKLDVNVGLRYEYMDYLFRADGVRDPDVSRTDHLLTPDVSLGYTFGDDAGMGLSYRMATVRPPYSQLTGSLAYVGRHEIEGGNPALRDERQHDVQLYGSWHGFMLQADYTRSLDTYAFVKRIYPAESLQLIMQPVNVDVSALSLYLTWSRQIGRWSPNFTAGMYRQWLRLDATKYDRPIYSYYLENVLALPAAIQLTLNVYGQSSGDMHTNRFGTTWACVDASVSRWFCGKSLQLRLSATDIFNTANNDWTMNTCGVSMYKRQTYDRRGVSLSVTWRFQPRPSGYKGRNASEAELKRL